MILENIINISSLCITGHIGNMNDISKFRQYYQYNSNFINKFKTKHFIINFEETNKYKLFAEFIRHYGSYIPLWENRGHNFGSADLDNKAFDFCKETNKKWMCKMSMDVIVEPNISKMLSLEVPDDVSFLYMNGIGYGGMEKYNFDYNEIIKNDFYPQTNFYFIDISKVDYLNNKKYINETYEIIKNTPSYNGKVWEYIPGWSCEDFLKQCVLRNNLKKHHLISDESYFKLLNAVEHNYIHDPSHKNIMIDSVCHFHDNSKNVLYI